MKQDLYIIGNGFDLHHDIPSGYPDFRNWLKSQDEDMYSNLNEYFNASDKNEWWSNFEANLSKMDISDIAINLSNENYPNVGSDDYRDCDLYAAEYATERKIKEIFNGISDAMITWLEQLPKGNPQKKISIENDAWFLTFNYTSTLERSYNINPNNILHIHRDIHNPIYGHNCTSGQLAKKFGKFETEDSTYSYVFDRAKDASIFTLASQKKPVDRIIMQNEEWFSQLSDIKHIHIYGFSMNPIDAPYLDKIFDVVNKNEIDIEISDYKGENAINIKDITKKYDIKNYKIVDLNDFVDKGQLSLL